MYGQELIIDCCECDPSTFTRDNISKYLDAVCETIGATKCDRHFWDDCDVPANEQQTRLKTKGTTAIQFLLESNITIHTLDLLGEVYINVFYCGLFYTSRVEYITRDYFGGYIDSRTLIRG